LAEVKAIERQTEISSDVIGTRDLKVYFERRQNIIGSRIVVHAVDGISLAIKRGEVLSLVGESGSGKSTLARTIVKLNMPTEGAVFFQGQDIFKLSRGGTKRFRRKVQMIFQDPYESLNPQSNVFNIVLDPMIIHNLVSHGRAEREERVSELLKMVGLDPSTRMNRYPHELSGGERQRVSIARALSLTPEFVIADEPVSMLDVSIRIGILNLMLSLKEKFNLTYLFITHDLGVAKYIGTRIAVMYFGKIVEIASSDEIINHPMHHYTNLLLASIPQSPKANDTILSGSKTQSDYVLESTNPPPGCRFNPRCPYANEKCRTEEPILTELSPGHFVACHYPLSG